jgi:hypothetical protein
MLRGTTSIHPFGCTLRPAITGLRSNGRSRAGLLSRGFSSAVYPGDLRRWGCCGGFQPVTSFSISVPRAYSSRNNNFIYYTDSERERQAGLDACGSTSGLPSNGCGMTLTGR